LRINLQLYDFQQDFKTRIYEAWQKHRNVIGVLPTAAGKTVTFSSILHNHNGSAVAIAHRKELVNQISLALAREGVVHGIIGPQSTIKDICNDHARQLGAVLYDPNSRIKVAGIDTLIRRKKDLEHWSHQVTLWVTDEAHHLLRSNKWGQGVEMFPNSYGLGVTATPCRADGRGLGAHADGVFTDMVVGPSMRELIDRGFLTDYRVFCPPNDIDLTDVNIARDGDFNQPRLARAVRESHLVGDIVDHYIKIAPGKLGVTFATDVETATDIAAQYNAKGIPAEVVSAKTPTRIRNEIIARFRNGSIKQLVNVDLFGEGFDLPAIEVVSMGRPTQSYGLYVQQFGRALRIMEGKFFGIIIDHAGNVIRHGLPDRERVWSLDARERRPRSINPEDDIPLRYCVECTQPYERILVTCPWCGTKWVPAVRSGPEHVDGDLFELEPHVLERMRGEVIRIDEDPLLLASRMRAGGAPNGVVFHATRNHTRRQEAQRMLRDRIAWWAAWHHQAGESDPQIQRRFWHMFGTDLMTAQTLGRNDAIQLALKVDEQIERYKS
jgi:superfamily II DNA or RNA helicase